MAHVTGTRRVRMVGAERWTAEPEQELAVLEAGDGTYAVHERLAVDSPRLRLVLSAGEDPETAARELHGEVVRDVRVFRLAEVPGAGDAAEGLLQWRFTLPALEDPAQDPLPALVARLAGEAADVVDIAVAPDAAPVTAEVGEEAPTAAAVVLDDVAETAEIEDAVATEAAVTEPAAEPTDWIEDTAAAEAAVPEPAAESDLVEVLDPDVEAEAAAFPDVAAVPMLEPLPEAPPLVVVPTVADVVAPALEPWGAQGALQVAAAAEPVEDVVVAPVEPTAIEDLDVLADEPSVDAADEAGTAAADADVVEAEVASAVAFDDVFEDPYAVPADAVLPLEAETDAVADAADVEPATGADAEVVDETEAQDVAETEAELVIEAEAQDVAETEAELVAENEAQDVEAVEDEQPATPASGSDEAVAPAAELEAEAEAESEAGPVEAVEAADSASVEAEEPGSVVVEALDAEWAPVAAVVAGDRPACSSTDRHGVCAAPADVVWQTAAGAAWACAWHWPSTMSGHVGAEVGAVHQPDGWMTWRDADPLGLTREAADLFTAAARGHDHPVARALVALDALDDMLRRLPDDVRGAILLWSVAVTNPEWDVDAVAQHGRIALEQAQAQGRAVAFPDELYFQEQALHVPISPTGDEPPVVEAAPQIDGELLFEQGSAAAEAGDVRTAKRLWTDAAEGASHALAMRALGDLARDSDDIKTAEEWYGRAAFQNEPTSMTRIGMIYLQKGQSERAAEWLRRAARFGDDEATTILQSLMAAPA